MSNTDRPPGASRSVPGDPLSLLLLFPDALFVLQATALGPQRRLGRVPALGNVERGLDDLGQAPASLLEIAEAMAARLSVNDEAIIVREPGTELLAKPQKVALGPTKTVEMELEAHFRVRFVHVLATRTRGPARPHLERLRGDGPARG